MELNHQEWFIISHKVYKRESPHKITRFLSNDTTKTQHKKREESYSSQLFILFFM